MPTSLPSETTMYTALLEKDPAYEGIFFAGITTTGIFCRPTCTARKPKRENVSYFPSTRAALLSGYRPCKICRPLTRSGSPPTWLKPLLEEIESAPETKIKDHDLRTRGLDPNRVRRWFKKHHGMTFQAYQRTLRVSEAFGRIKNGEPVIHAAYEAGYESLSGFGDSFKKATGFSPKGSAAGRIVHTQRILTPLGPMLAGATDDGLCLLEFADRRMVETQMQRLGKRLNAEFIPGANPHIEATRHQLEAYFAGTLQKFDIPLVLAGTPFQQQVWAALQTIPFGKTRSYKEQAEMIGKPTAVRAVARANGDNRLAIIIPCHRVIGADGQLTGYGGGLWRKRYLLDLEIGVLSP